ncbi:MAG: type II toxin-antitoxin system VapC family toxin [Myxococcota bacterium]
MRFWDSSALVPVLIEEPASAWCRTHLEADAMVGVWVLTRTEMISALRRKEREGELARDAVRIALRRLAKLERSWTEVDALLLVRPRAERLMGAHPLRAADALQIAAALVLVNEQPAGFQMVTADGRLADAAEAEGFEVLVPR